MGATDGPGDVTRSTTRVLNAFASSSSNSRAPYLARQSSFERTIFRTQVRC